MLESLHVNKTVKKIPFNRRISESVIKCVEPNTSVYNIFFSYVFISGPGDKYLPQ